MACNHEHLTAKLRLSLQCCVACRAACCIPTQQRSRRRPVNACASEALNTSAPAPQIVAWPDVLAKTERSLVITKLDVGASYSFRVAPQPGTAFSAWSDPIAVDAAEAVTLSKAT